MTADNGTYTMASQETTFNYDDIMKVRDKINELPPNPAEALANKQGFSLDRGDQMFISPLIDGAMDLAECHTNARTSRLVPDYEIVLIRKMGYPIP